MTKKRRLSDLTLEDTEEFPLIERAKGVRLITKKEVSAAMLFCKAKLVCANVVSTNEIEVLSKVLAELNNIELSVRFAISHNLSPVYALTLLMVRTSDEAELARFIPTLSAPHLVDLCQNLIASEITLPECLVRRVQDSSYVT